MGPWDMGLPASAKCGDESGRERPGRCRLTCARARGTRNSLLLGFAGAFRGSELIALEVADMQEAEDGLRVVIRRCKSDKEGKGRGRPMGAKGGRSGLVHALSHCTRVRDLPSANRVSSRDAQALGAGFSAAFP